MTNAVVKWALADGTAMPRASQRHTPPNGVTISVFQTSIAPSRRSDNSRYNNLFTIFSRRNKVKDKLRSISSYLELQVLDLVLSC